MSESDMSEKTRDKKSSEESRLSDQGGVPDNPEVASGKAAGEVVYDAESIGLKRAMAAMRRGNRPKAMELFELALESEPRNAVLLARAAIAYGRKSEIDRMEALVERMEAMGSNDPRMFQMIGDIYETLRYPIKAIPFFEKARDLDGESPDVLWQLATCYLKTNRLDEAEETYDFLISVNPRALLGWTHKAMLARTRGDLDQAEKILQPLLEWPDLDANQRATVWHALVRVKDEQGDFDSAFHAATQAKEFLPPYFNQKKRTLKNGVRMLRECHDQITATELHRWHDEAGSDTGPDVAFLTGFLRSGTTLIEHVLDAHDGVICSDENPFLHNDLRQLIFERKTPDCSWADCLNRLTSDRIEDFQQRYIKAMESKLYESIGDRIHLDKNPWCASMLLPTLRIFPHAKILFALRDPRDVVLSCFLSYTPDRDAFVCFENLESTARRYSFSMACWLKLREIIKSPWREIRYEDTVNNLERQAKGALETLGLPWDEGVLDYRENTSDAILGGPNHTMVSKPIYKTAMARWKLYEKHLEPVMDMLDPFIKAFGYD
jgi:tetratricopeptide (TPR) repeat protein